MDDRQYIKELESRCRKAVAKFEGLKETNKAMESVLSLIGKHLKIEPGDVPSLLDAIGSLTAEVRVMREALNTIQFRGSPEIMLIAMNALKGVDTASGRHNPIMHDADCCCDECTADSKQAQSFHKGPDYDV